MSDTERLDEIEARANAATDGATLDRYAHGGGRLAVFEVDRLTTIPPRNLDDDEYRARIEARRERAHRFVELDRAALTAEPLPVQQKRRKR